MSVQYKGFRAASMNVLFILTDSFIQTKLTDVCLYGNIQVSAKTLREL